tara:strand:+ start:137 stop:835 length:699 start_codon:yes stop_codon:yes gene_type:complete
MKKIVLNSLLLLFTFNFLCSQTYIKNDAYEVMYSQAFQQPITVAYKYPDFKVYTVVGLEKINGITNKVSYPDPVEIKTSINWKVPENIVTSDKDDYSSPYDRGHLAPAASFTKDEQQKFIHSYLNCAIMHKALNRGVWKTLENRERELSDTNKVRVKIILSFSNKNNLAVGGATIPTSFTKIIEYGDTYIKPIGKKYQITREVYSFPNNESVKNTDLNSYKVKSLSGKFSIN